MESKPTVEQFMSDFFRERTKALKLRLEIDQTHRPRFYHRDCLWASGRGAVEHSEAETIVSVSPSEIGFGVVTTGNGLHRLRYHVKPFGESWSIHEIDTECSHYRIFGASYDCAKCGGTGWLSWKDETEWLKRHGQNAARPTRPHPDEESEGSMLRDPAIEQFMTDYFRERTLAWKKEKEIYGDYMKSFYSPECDWTRWAMSVQMSEAERIVGVLPLDLGAHVITRDFSIFRQRYRLLPAGQSWLILEIGLECFNCYRNGRSADCFLCGGTIWDRKKDKGGLARSGQPGEEPPPDHPRWKLE